MGGPLRLAVSIPGGPGVHAEHRGDPCVVGVLAETALALLLYISSFRAMPKCPELSVLVKILAGERYKKDVEILSISKFNQFRCFT